MEALLRIEVNLVALAILAILLVHIRYDISAMLDDFIFRVLLYASVVSVMLDTITWIVDGKSFVGAGVILTIVNVLYFISCVYVPYLWLTYVDFRLRRNTHKLKNNNLFYRFPLFLFGLLMLATPFTGWVFYVDAQNVYHRGPLYMIQVGLSFLYVLYASALSFREAFIRKLPEEKMECYTLTSFIIFPVLGAIIQVMYYGLALVSICIVLSELLIFVNVQNRQLTMDPLTKINNRGQLDRYLEIRTNQGLRDKTLYMVLLDIDKFKKINDTYGHKVGDRAIIHMANILKQVTTRHQYFLARYGGDEFVVVLECKSEDTVRELLHDIAMEVQRFNREQKMQYKLSYSIGYAAFGQDDIHSVEALLEAADLKMYEHKRR